jgi:hypothetical protein
MPDPVQTKETVEVPKNVSKADIEKKIEEKKGT